MKKTPISYYGGKQKVAPKILHLIPKGRYTQYVEPFAGGAAVFWAKGPEKSVSEVLNDRESTVINFWEVCSNPVLFPLLAEMIQNTLHHRQYYEESKTVLKKYFGNPEALRNAPDTDKLEAAWAVAGKLPMTVANLLRPSAGFAYSGGGEAKNTANKASRYSIRDAADMERVRLAHALYMQTVLGFAKIPMSGFGTTCEARYNNTIPNKLARFKLSGPASDRMLSLTNAVISRHEDEEIAEMKALFAAAEPLQIDFKNEIHDRLKGVEFHNIDAVELINKKDLDGAATFFEIDPPYPNSDCGHYKGYTFANFERLLKRLESLREDSLFMLHNYPSDMLREYAHRNNWIVEELDMSRSAAHSKDRNGDRKTEVIVRNYRVGNDNQTSLF